MQKTLNLIDGKKTYIIAIIAAVYNLAVACGWVPATAQVDINVILGALGTGAVRSALSKLQA